MAAKDKGGASAPPEPKAKAPESPRRFRVVTSAILHDGADYPVGAVVEASPLMVRDAGHFLEPLD